MKYFYYSYWYRRNGCAQGSVTGHACVGDPITAFMQTRAINAVDGESVLITFVEITKEQYDLMHGYI